jgi:hypothetical protein
MKYMGMKKVSQNQYVIETIEVDKGKIISKETSEPLYLVSAFDYQKQQLASGYIKALKDA